MYSLDINDPSPEWQEIKLKPASTNGFLPNGISRHTAVIWDDKLFCLGGEQNNTQAKNFFYINIAETSIKGAHLTAECTQMITSKQNAPLELDSHTAILYPESDNGEADKMIVFGGYYRNLKTSKIFEYTFEHFFWRELNPEDEDGDEKLEEIKKSMKDYDVITDTMMEN